MKQHTYIAIDLKSFYASVECRERGLDPLDTNLVVADESRTDKTICLAVTPSLKSYGISGRGRLFEVKQRVKEANIEKPWSLWSCSSAATAFFKSVLRCRKPVCSVISVPYCTFCSALQIPFVSCSCVL